MKAELVNEWKRDNKLWKESIKNTNKAIKEVSSHVDAILKLVNKVQQDENFDAQLIGETFSRIAWNDKKKEEILANMEIDVEAFTRSLEYEMHFDLAKIRRRWLWLSNTIFKTNKATVTILKIIASALAGSICEAIIQFIFPVLPVGAGVLIGGFTTYLTTDKIIEKLMNKAFWQIHIRWVVSLVLHLKLYTDQMNYLVTEKAKRIIEATIASANTQI